MSRGDKPNQGSDRAKEGDSKIETSIKVAGESVTDEAQAQRYEPKFKTFSGLHDQKLLATRNETNSDTTPNLRTSDTHRARNAKNSDDVFEQFMQRVNPNWNSPPNNEGSVSEFVLEDRAAGKEYTANGERYTPRKSFKDGLKAILGLDGTPMEIDEHQGSFCIEYIERHTAQFLASVAQKTQDFLGSVTSPFLPKQAPIEHTPGISTSEQQVKDCAISAAHESSHYRTPLGEAFPDELKSIQMLTDMTSESKNILDTDPVTGQQVVKIGRHRYGTDSVIAEGIDNKSDAADPQGVRAWEKAKDPPLSHMVRTLLQLRVKEAKEYVEKWEVSGDVHEVKDVPKAIVDTYTSLLKDPRRDKGEFNFAFGEKDGKIYMSRVWFNPGVPYKESELQEPLGIFELEQQKHVSTILSADHSHPLHKDKAYWTFSPDDLALAQKYDGQLHMTFFSNRDKRFVPCLLTPAPDNKLMYYDVNYNIADKNYIQGAKRIRDLGPFSSTGQFIPNEQEMELLKTLGFIK